MPKQYVVSRSHSGRPPPCTEYRDMVRQAANHLTHWKVSPLNLFASFDCDARVLYTVQIMAEITI